MSKKYQRIGQVLKNYDGDGESFKLSLEDLKSVVKLLRTYGANVLGNLEVDDIRAAKKLKKGDPNRLLDPFISRFDKTQDDYDKGCPDFVLADLCIKIADFEE